MAPTSARAGGRAGAHSARRSGAPSALGGAARRQALVRRASRRRSLRRNTRRCRLCEAGAPRRSGSRARRAEGAGVIYRFTIRGGQAPWVESRLQDFFGSSSTPTRARRALALGGASAWRPTGATCRSPPIWRGFGREPTPRCATSSCGATRGILGRPTRSPPAAASARPEDRVERFAKSAEFRGVWCMWPALARNCAALHDAGNTRPLAQRTERHEVLGRGRSRSRSHLPFQSSHSFARFAQLGVANQKEEPSWL